jgi:four helix bundle protein
MIDGRKRDRMRDFRKLQVWEKSHALVLGIYQSIQRFPKDELSGLTSHMRRASVSIPANIAEGAGRESIPERVHLTQIANGSASELNYFLLLSRDLGYLPEEVYLKYSRDLDEIGRMLTGLMKTLKAK